MEYEKNVCPVLNVDGILATGKQFDLDITLPEDNRTVIYGVVKDCYQEPVCEAVVKLVEGVCECGKEERRPVSHTFTDEDGEFVFGPLCANRFYEIEIWVDRVKHCKVCTKVERDGKCLKGIKMDCKKEMGKPCCREEYKDCKEDCKKEHKEEHKEDDCKRPCHDKCEEYKDCDKKDKCCDKKEDCCDKKEECCCKKEDCCDKKEDCCCKKEECCDKKPERPCRPFGRIY